ncbi:sugar transferase [Halobacterium salinarum]|uniref:sugar transferase n=1 Tax=Halobacterium salinarum TaxID=2242 RepID=UPI0025566459|nr:sugar transferase [Halobacterium salinarum]MDL0139100.1 sugar transferase [Halobacterium salinarum]
MLGGWRYRLGSIAGVCLLTALAVGVANSPTGQTLTGALPVFAQLAADPPGVAEGLLEVSTTVCVVAVACLPLYKPRPRRVLDVVVLAQKRVVVALFALAAIGYFDYTYRLPRTTLLAVTPVLLVAVPALFVWIRRRPTPTAASRTIVVGDTLDEIERLVADIDHPLYGYVCPTVVPRTPDAAPPHPAVADGGSDARALNDHDRLGGLSRIEDVLVAHDIDTVVLAFERTDRAEFFGALDACYEHGVAAKVHRDHADRVLTADDDVGTLATVDVEPWDVQDYVLKRGFDIAFSAAGLLLLSPVILAITGAIKLDDGGTVLYNQERTAAFGETFDVYKFRSMVENAEDRTGATISDEDDGGVDSRVTRVGRVLRQTHLDEIPQLWAVLKGDMSVVGPRPERPELDSDIQTGVVDWRKRWFVKPGLTGLAQVHDVTGTEPVEKLRYDLQYVKQQSLGYDVKLVIRQIWKVGVDAVDTLRQ